MAARRIAFLNNKGGVGKTFATVALAEAAARRGLKVLVVDLDPQANATRRLRVPTGAHERTLTGCLRLGVQQGAAKDCVFNHGWDEPALTIDVLPADLDLEDRALEAGQPGADIRLRKALFGMDDDYDLTLIDCPPSIKGHLTRLGIAALDGFGDTVLVPLKPEYDDIAGAKRAIDFIELFREDLGVGNLNVFGLIVNGYRTGTNLHSARVDKLRETLALPVLTVVPLRSRIAELQDAGQPLNAEPELRSTLMQFVGLVDALLPRAVTA
jgi:cellulose biosynthesis protein BcsQ